MSKSKYLVIALAVASLAALSEGCTPKGKQVATLTVQVIEACNLPYIPAPPALFWESQDGCIGVSMCSEQAKADIASWIVELAKWGTEAQECINLIRDTYSVLKPSE